jgi:hypothetical protein
MTSTLNARHSYGLGDRLWSDGWTALRHFSDQGCRSAFVRAASDARHA